MRRATEKSNSWIKRRGKGDKEEERKGESLETQKPPSNSEGDVRAGEGGERRGWRARRGIIAEGSRSYVALAKKS